MLPPHRAALGGQPASRRREKGMDHIVGERKHSVNYCLLLNQSVNKTLSKLLSPELFFSEGYTLDGVQELQRQFVAPQVSLLVHVTVSPKSRETLCTQLKNACFCFNLNWR